MKERGHPDRAAATTAEDLVAECSGSGPWPTMVPGQLQDCGPAYRVLDAEGRRLRPAPPEQVTEETELALALWRHMVRLRIIDERMLAMQRQGRIGFYGAITGQEAGVFGAAAALQLRDWVHPALREGGMALWRGFSLRTWLANCFGNVEDTCTKGRQMPCHYGSRALNHVTLSSVMTTQFPQAVGTAFAMAARCSDAEDATGDRPVCFAAIGDGATSEGDFHVAMNMAGVLRPRGKGLPLVLFCANNQWAISTPYERQTAAPTLAHRAIGYGLGAARVDGNDALAVFQVVAEATRRARVGEPPVFIEAMTYRVGAHTTSDDPSRYRDERVTEAWRALDPITRLQRYLLACGQLDEAAVEAHARACDEEVRTTLASVEALPPVALHTLFDDVYAELPPHLLLQRQEAEAAAEALAAAGARSA